MCDRSFTIKGDRGEVAFFLRKPGSRVPTLVTCILDGDLIPASKCVMLKAAKHALDRYKEEAVHLVHAKRS